MYTGTSRLQPLLQHQLDEAHAQKEVRAPQIGDGEISPVIHVQVGVEIVRPDTEMQHGDAERCGNARAKGLGHRAQEIDAVLSLRPQRLGDVRRRLDAVRAFAALPQATALAAANKRITNILKKADQVDGNVQAELLHEPAEQALHQAMAALTPQAHAQWERGDYTASLQTLAALREPVDAFFEDVMVNAEQPELRRNRLVLLQQLHQSMNRVADLSRLAS